MVYRIRFFFHRYLISVFRWLIGYACALVLVGLLVSFEVLATGSRAFSWWTVAVAAAIWMLLSTASMLVRWSGGLPYLRELVPIAALILPWFMWKLIPMQFDFWIGQLFAYVFAGLYVYWASTSKIPPSDFVTIYGYEEKFNTLDDFTKVWRFGDIIRDPYGGEIDAAEATNVLSPDYRDKHWGPR